MAAENSVIEDPKGHSDAIVAIEKLLEVIKNSEAGTMIRLTEEIKSATKDLIEMELSKVSVSSGCELFLRFITFASLEQLKFEDCRSLLLKRGNLFLQKAFKSRDKIAEIGAPFIRDNTTILVHSRSRVVLRLLQEAVSNGKRIKIFITASNIDNTGITMQKFLKESGIASKLILDSAAGYLMEKVDLVMVGAEGVAESGGIINKIGTYQIAVMAKTLNKPFYVVAESFKFVRMFPLNQDDLPNTEKYSSVDSAITSHPVIDYTPPCYITLLITDLGVLTPSAVSDELIKLYM
ncbi:PREDICTED: translation initiation factor eIF-2B subunit alpha-like [Amphimedon queenslandica]|uniref:Translation initiation factor eIF2B subunit alpha n=1 Tax=Amphimedon queenslandica TaxID=400682 RepID=A0A1X7U6G0_AMPQE|nr:PREDICTED: translation initiation factor eIF-2B subunit alpha-like [Amphimedon queenslandica]|eukprot:XP_003388928.1 PREDICTED: translation initiation factor eIF-2B subunit alpha-like [Amphimedon queenslandica]